MGQTHHDGISMKNLVVTTKATVPAPSDNTDAATKKYVDDINTALTSAIGGVADVVVTTVSLTSAEIKALLATPKELVPAPAANKAIMVLQVVAALTRPAATYTNAGGEAKILIGSGEIVDKTTFTAVFTSASSIIKSLLPTTNITLVAATALTLAKITNEFAAGDGTLKLTIAYSIVDV